MTTMKWCVYITGWDGKNTRMYFHNKTEAYTYFKAHYQHSLSAQILYYNGLIWICKKYYV